LISFPLLSGGFIFGVWMVIMALMGNADGRVNAPFDRFLSPAALVALLGILFASISVCVSWVFLKSLPALFPYECRFRSLARGSWAVQRKLWFVSSPWKELGDDWVIWCYPGYSRGEWGYSFHIKNRRARLRLASAGAHTESKDDAQSKALKDMAVLEALFGVAGEFKKWK
jgi:hypothetical protein